MARPSKNTDQLLLQAARRLIPKTGCTGLSLRQVAEDAGVNLGMFHYHFKSKEEFTRRILQDVYEEFFKELTLSVDPSASPEERLRASLLVLGRFTREQRALLVALIRDVLNEDQEVVKFFKENFGRHFQLILDQVRACKESNVLQDLPDPLILLLLLSSVGLPHLAVDFLERSHLISAMGIKKLVMHKLFLTESALLQRIDLAIRSVSRKVSATLIVLLALFGQNASAGERTIDLRLDGLVQKAVESSGRVAATRSEREAASSRASALVAQFFPRLSFEAGVRYVTQVPTLSVNPSLQIPFGDHTSYSVGPVINWTVWDSGATFNSWRSLLAAENQKSEEARVAELQIVLAAQLGYFRVMLASAQMSAVTDALALAQAQYDDIQAKLRTGAASQADALIAGREVLSFESKYLQAQSDLAQALQELLAMSGQTENYDLTLPVSPEVVKSGRGAHSVIVTVEPVSQVFAKFDEKKLLAAQPSTSHPQIAALSYQVDTLLKASDSAKSGHWPKVSVFAKTSLDYPNGPNLEQIHQTSLGATLTWSIFESGRVWNEVREKAALATASSLRKEQAQSDLIRDWSKVRSQLAILRSQQKIHRLSAEESKKISKLVYSAYRIGRSNLLEVQSANLRLLESKIQADRTDIQILIQLAQLSSLVSASSIKENES